MTTTTTYCPTTTYEVDLSDDCTGQEFRVKRTLCILYGEHIAIVAGMGLNHCFYVGAETDEELIHQLLAGVNAVPTHIRSV